MVWKVLRSNKRGLAMGQRLAPSLAIAFMSKVRAPVTDLGPLLYCRFGRRTLMLWLGFFNIVSLMLFVVFEQLSSLFEPLKWGCIVAMTLFGITYGTVAISWKTAHNQPPPCRRLESTSIFERQLLNPYENRNKPVCTAVLGESSCGALLCKHLATDVFYGGCKAFTVTVSDFTEMDKFIVEPITYRLAVAKAFRGVPHAANCGLNGDYRERKHNKTALRLLALTISGIYSIRRDEGRKNGDGDELDTIGETPHTEGVLVASTVYFAKDAKTVEFVLDLSAAMLLFPAVCHKFSVARRLKELKKL
ncbi:unnamed protein product [Angiostrongylus costaricensis]|uniref:Uncharacterized protein n=1 Tax=Angiostrongylus costaricensis TaxID=334426 RepID=A0A158PG39_ANGCS|nr:unnamed protein product [Angiostrongylus costaricensis]